MVFNLSPLFLLLAAAQLGITISNFELEDLWLACVSGTSNHLNPPEPIHIFALAHCVARPIIVLPFSTPLELSKRPRNLLSLASSRSNPYHILEGFYVPYFSKNEIFTRSPICLLHENGQFYNWLSNNNEGMSLFKQPHSPFSFRICGEHPKLHHRQLSPEPIGKDVSFP